MDSAPSMELYAKRMSLVVAIISLTIIIGGVIFYRSSEIFAFSLGVAMAVAFNIVSIRWLKHSIEKAMEMEPTSGHMYIRGQGMLRMLLFITMLVGAGLLAQLDFFGLPVLIGAVLASLSKPIAAYSMVLFKDKNHEKI